MAREPVAPRAEEPTPGDPHSLIVKLEAAHRIVVDLCQGRREWTMSIPARPDSDPDLVIGAALREAEQYVRSSSPSAAGAPRRDALFAHIGAELDRAYRKHGCEPWGRHEFYAILREEVDELWDAIKGDLSQDEVEAELTQVAAMCFRYYETGDRYRGAAPSQPQEGQTTGDASPGEQGQ